MVRGIAPGAPRLDSARTPTCLVSGPPTASAPCAAGTPRGSRTHWDVPHVDAVRVAPDRGEFVGAASRLHARPSARRGGLDP